MCKWREIINFFLFGMLLLSAAGHAQEDKLLRAQQLYQEKRPELALLVIDSVVTHPETSKDFQSWTTRAYIYFDLYKRSDRSKLQSPLRDSLVSSLVVSQQLQPDSLYSKMNKNLLSNIAAGYYNMAKDYLQDSVDYESSSAAFSKYRSIFALAEPGYDFKSRDIEFNLAAGSIFLDEFMRDQENTKARDIAKVSLLKVLELQPDNTSALINMGLMHYNHAVYLNKKIDYGVDLSTLEVVQEDMIKLAKQAEQFIVQVYREDNNNPKAVHALCYIYRMLLDFKKYDEFKAKCKVMGIDVEQSEQ